VLPVEILKKLSEEMDATLQQAKSACAEGLALTSQQLTDDERHAAVVASIQETAIVIEQFQQALRRALGLLAAPKLST
jgi:hypothetical protein